MKRIFSLDLAGASHRQRFLEYLSAYLVVPHFSGVVVYVINYKTSTGSWEPLFGARAKALYPLLMAELDAIKQMRPTGGLMLRRDGSSLPWFGKGKMLTQVQRISKKIILAADLRPELTFTSFVVTAAAPKRSPRG